MADEKTQQKTPSSAPAEQRTATSTTTDAPSADFDRSQTVERGWFGTRPHEIDDAEYSLETGPNSPNGNLVPGTAELFKPEA